MNQSVSIFKNATWLTANEFEHYQLKLILHKPTKLLFRNRYIEMVGFAWNSKPIKSQIKTKVNTLLNWFKTIVYWNSSLNIYIQS